MLKAHIVPRSLISARTRQEKCRQDTAHALTLLSLDHFTKGFSIVIQIQWKFQFTIIHISINFCTQQIVVTLQSIDKHVLERKHVL